MRTLHYWLSKNHYSIFLNVLGLILAASFYALGWIYYVSRLTP